MKKVLILTFTGIILLALVVKACNPSNSDEYEEYDEKTPLVGNIEKCQIIELSADSVIISYLGFKVLYKAEILQPVWVEYTMTAEQVEQTKHTPKIPRHYSPDPELLLPQASDYDYKGSGWTRGHMAKRQDLKWSEQAVRESDYFTNICPQNSVLNNGIWDKVEKDARDLATQYDSIRIVCGPIFTDTINGFIGDSHIPVPDYFFKVLLVFHNNRYNAIAYVFPNSSEPLTLSEATKSVNQVEELTKIDFFSYLDDSIEEGVEDVVDMSVWEIEGQ